MNEIAAENSLPCLRRLCCTVTEVLNNSNKYVFLVRSRYEQASSALEIYKNENNKPDKPKCTCSTEETNAELNFDSILMNKVSKTIRNAQQIRSQSSTSKISKVSTENLNLTKCTSTKLDTSKRKTSATNLKTKVELKSNSSRDVHTPSCPLYDFKAPSKHIYSPNVPAELTKCVKLFHTYVSNLEFDKKSANNKHRNLVLKELEEHNEELFCRYETEDPVIALMPKYLSAFPKIQWCYEEIKNEFLYVIYTNAQDLKMYQNQENCKLNNELWNMILEAIIQYVLPVLQSSKLKRNEKIYFYKVIKTIYNCRRNNVSRVPIFKIK